MKYPYRSISGLVCLATLHLFGLFSWKIVVAEEIGPATGHPVYVFDLTALNQLDKGDPKQARQAWDTLHLAASVQGIVNRNEARLFIRFMEHPDDFWFRYLREETEWLANRPICKIGSLEALLKTFQEDLRGVVVYNEEVRATSNLASTIAGVEDRVCLRHDPSSNSVYTQVMAMKLSFLEDVRKLFHDDGSPLFSGESGSKILDTEIPSTGSDKCDAHLWAKHHFLDAGLTSSQYMAFYIDSFWLTAPTKSGLSNCTLTNHDFFIANKAFFFDLHVWEEESPIDDQGQEPGTDVKTLKKLMRSMHDRADGKIFHIGGFTPWAWKYTTHAGPGGSKHGGVDSEWKYGQLISAYNGIMDADALGYSGMVNASFYQHFPLEDHYPQNKRPTLDDVKAQGLIREDGSVAPLSYTTFYMGDYDSAAWLNYFVPRWWNDPAHGEVMCSWAFNANLDRRAPHAMHYVRSRQSSMDWFISGDNGAGYLNPGMLTAPRLDPSLPDGWDAWVAHNREYFRRYDLSITGFIIDGHSPGMGNKGMDAYMKFSPDGIVGQKIPPQGVYQETMPYIRMRLDLHGSPPDAGKRIASLIDDRLAKEKMPQFMVIRTILQSPSWHRQTMRQAQQAEGGQRLRFVDPYTFFLLLKAHETRKLTASDR